MRSQSRMQFHGSHSASRRVAPIQSAARVLHLITALTGQGRAAPQGIRPWSRWRQTSGLLAALAVLPADPAAALDRTWIGGNVDWVDGEAPANWTGGDEPDSDDTAIFNTANTVNLGSSNSILGLTMSGGISLNTNDFDLTLDGLLQLTGSGTDLTIGGSASLVFADDITINSGADIILDGGSLTMTNSAGTGLFDINAGGILTGQGTVFFGDGLAAPTSLLTNSGTISAAFPGLIFGTPPAGTLAINASDTTDARLDLDLGGSAVLNVFRNQTLDINVTLANAYSDDLNLYHNSTIDVSTPWSIDAGATVDIDNGFVDNGGILNIPASTSFISGATFTQSGGTITVIDNDGALQFNAAFTMSGGNLVNNGEVIFNANAAIAAAANFTMPTSASSLTVNAGVEVNIDQADFNADGGGFSTNVITVGSGGILDLDLGVGADTGLGGTVILNGGELDVTTDSNTWSLDTSVTVGASTGTSQINGEAVTFPGTAVTVGASSILDVNASSTWSTGTSASVGAGASMRLDGSATLNGAAFTGAGTLVLGSTSTVTANTTLATGILDWDGPFAGSLHTISSAVGLTITSPVITDGGMYDPINLGGNGGSLTVSGPSTWAMRNTFTSNTADLGTSTIAGTSRMILDTAQGILNADGDTTISAPVTFGSLSTTNIAAPAILTVSGNAIYDGGTITGAGTYNPPSGNNNTVSSSSTISAANFDFDRGNWLVQSGATLTVNVTDIEPLSGIDTFDSTITIQSGAANVTTGHPAFVMDGILNLNNTTGTAPVWSGEALEIGDDANTLDADLNVTGTGTSQINSPITFLSDANVNVAAGSTLVLASTATFNSVNAAENAKIAGSGTLVTGSNVNFNETTTLDFAGGTVDLDGTVSDNTANTVNVPASVVINAAAVDSFGNSGNLLGLANTIVLSNFASLTVNLTNPASEWTLNSAGVLTINTVGGGLGGGGIQGSDFNMLGTTNISGNSIWNARTDLFGTVNVAAASSFNLRGGTLADPNTLRGGTITGTGALNSLLDEALVGFGTIDTTVDFKNNTELKADDGILNVNGTILDVGVIGTADGDGILNVTNAWNTNIANSVVLMGGELRGATVTTGTGGINGFGLVSSRVINNTYIEAGNSGTLVLQTAGNDNEWDGTDAPEDGILRASGGGTLECRDNALFTFDGAINAVGGGTVFSNGFAFTLSPTSTLSLASGGTYKSTNSTDIEGAVTVGGGADSTIDIQINRFLTFEATSSTTLNGNLRLVTNNGIIRAGATFGGAGALKIAAGSIVGPENLAIINVLLDNSGRLKVANFGIGRVDAKDFQQSASGELEIDLNGTALADYDRLIIDGTAQINGDLVLEPGGGYVPALGDTFNVLSATGGVIGTFNPLVQPAGMPAGLGFEVNYSATLVQVKVVPKSPFELWIDTFGSLTDPADKTKGANPDGDGLNNLGEFALDGDPTSGLSSGKIVGKIAPVSGVNAMTLTLPVRSGAVLDAGDPPGGELVLAKAADDLIYRIQASDDLSNFTLNVTEVTGADAAAIQAGLPALHAGWVYRTFRSPGGVAGDPREFMRVVISE